MFGFYFINLWWIKNVCSTWIFAGEKVNFSVVFFVKIKFRTNDVRLKHTSNKMAEFYFTLYHDVRHLFFSHSGIRFELKTNFTYTNTRTHMQRKRDKHKHFQARHLATVRTHTVLIFFFRRCLLCFAGVQWNRCTAATTYVHVCAAYIEIHRRNETKWWCARNIDASDNTSEQHFTFYGWKFFVLSDCAGITKKAVIEFSFWFFYFFKKEFFFMK